MRESERETQAGSAEDSRITQVREFDLESIREDPVDNPDAAPRVGPYTVLRRVGKGGMGVVYAAYDVQLDRKIALKVLHRSRKTTTKKRVLREAQALAKLNHPNVVSVYATGEHAGRLYIAMEFIDGLDLTAWLRQQKPKPEAILASFKQAGVGLAAAHAAGLVHRDFKPHNVMIDASGHVKVLDFGLARRSQSREGSDETDEDTSKFVSVDMLSNEDLTQTGFTAGTPAYMAPEQLKGRRADPRTDQFSFCVSLWEALFGERPFQGKSMHQLLVSTTEGKLDAPKNVGKLAWLLPVLRRGLAVKPSKRWPDMGALIAALEPKRPRRLWMWGVGAAGVAVAGGLGWTATAPERLDPCTDGEHSMAATWSESRRERVRAAMLQSDRSYAHSIARTATGALDGYAAAWVESHRAACVDARDNGQSPQLRDARYACLDRSKHALGVLAQALEDGGGASVDYAGEGLATLPVIERCADIDHVTASVLPPGTPDLAKRVESTRDRLQRVSMMRTVGKIAEAEAEIAALAVEVADIDYAPIRAAVHLEGAQLALGSEDGAAAVRWAEAAYLDAHHVDPATAIETHLVLAKAYETEELYAPASREVRVALALIERWMPFDETFRMRAHEALGLSLHATGDYSAARDELKRAYDVAVEIFGPKSPVAAEAHLHLGVAESDLENLQSALEHATIARDIWSETCGLDHPDVARALNNVATVQRQLGNAAGASEALDRAIEIFAESYGQDNSNTLTARLNLSGVWLELGELERAETEVQTILEALRDDPGKRLRLEAKAHRSLGVIALERGDFAQSRRSFEQTLDNFRALFGPGSSAETDPLNLLAIVSAREGDLDQALERHQQVLQLHRTDRRSNPADLADAESNVGLILASLDRCESASPLLESGLDFWIPRITPDNAFAGWMVVQSTVTAMCAEMLGQRETAVEYAKHARAAQIDDEADANAAAPAKAIAQLIIDDARTSARAKAVQRLVPQVDPPLASLMRHWLEATGGERRSQAAASRWRK